VAKRLRRWDVYWALSIFFWIVGLTFAVLEQGFARMEQGFARMEQGLGRMEQGLGDGLARIERVLIERLPARFIRPGRLRRAGHLRDRL